MKIFHIPQSVVATWLSSHQVVMHLLIVLIVTFAFVLLTQNLAYAMPMASGGGSCGGGC